LLDHVWNYREKTSEIKSGFCALIFEDRI
jgi:hypothetical protein